MTDYIANRYVLHDMIGKGGMGAVYQATDRLTGQAVALKQVTAKSAKDAPRDTGAYRLALALEFRILASLRHPHIVSVLDYGFDANAQPFFTMTLLENAHPITEYAATLDDQTAKVRLVMDLLEALGYLHRRGLVHRDVKPQNVLVTPDGIVQVLDFGLALYTRESVSNVYEDGVGTIRYMSPELLVDEPASIQSDLYAVGVILYQILTNKYPYNQRNLGVLVQEIMNTTPDTTMLPVRLQRVVDKLLVKQPTLRYNDAQSVIVDLALALEMPPPEEDHVLRESYLQAARFVGREDELRTLRNAMAATLQGDGSQWLIGGESGIGKSRLLEELRTLALVEGAVVLRGQSVQSGERVYNLWRDVLRQLLLMVSVSDDEARTLKAIIPDIDTLLDRETPPARSLHGLPEQQVFIRTLIAVLTRYDKPLIILLEDLHWAGNSLDILQQLSVQAIDLPLLIIATYRDDERPDLPVHLSHMKPLTLSRLDSTHIEQLSAAMLGDAGLQPNVLTLLKEETEGNVFFMVEIVRALAENAGRLDAIGQGPLPKNILTGGVENVVQRRLSRLPEKIRDWLNAVAVAGRQLDLEIADALTAQAFKLSDALVVCANAAVLSVEGDTWRFAHDKIRESIIVALTDEDRADYHRAVATAIETTYPDDNTHVAILLEHWLAAGDQDKIIHYSPSGIHQTLKQGYIEDALIYAQSALSFMPPDSVALMNLHSRLGLIYQIMRRHHLSKKHYQTCLTLARDLKHHRGLVKALCGLASAHVALLTDLDRAQIHVREALILSGDDTTLLEDALYAAGLVAAAQGDFSIAQTHWQRSMAIHQQRGNQQRLANTLNQLGLLAMRKGDLNTAYAQMNQSIQIAETVGNYFSTTNQLLNLIDLEGWRGNFDAQKQHAERAIALWREHDARSQMTHGYFTLAHIEMSRRDYAAARVYLEKGIEITLQTEQPMDAAWLNYGWLARLEDNFTEALLSFNKALTITTEIGNRHAQAHILCQMALTALAAGHSHRAEHYAMQSWQMCSELTDDIVTLHIQILCGALLRDMDRADIGQSMHTQSLERAIEAGYIQHQIGAQAALARTHLAMGNIQGGREILQTSLHTAWDNMMLPYVLAGLLSDVDFLIHEGRIQQAAEQLHMIAQHPAVGYIELENRLDALILWDKLRQQLSIDAQQAAKTAGAELELAIVVQQRLNHVSTT